jgi:hypothetical protein
MPCLYFCISVILALNTFSCTGAILPRYIKTANSHQLSCTGPHQLWSGSNFNESWWEFSLRARYYTWNATFSKLRMQILKPKFDSHEASFDSQTRTSTRVSILRDLLARQCRGRSKHAVLNVFMARCESKGKRAFYFKTGLLKPVYDLVLI